MLKNKSLKFILLELFVIMIIMSVGYGKFSDATITGETVNLKSQFNIKFENAKVLEVKGADIEKTNVITSKNADTLTLNVSDLSYPGAYAKFSVEILNCSSIPAKLESIKIEGIEENSFIKIKGLEKVDHTILNQGEKYNLEFCVEWDRNCTVCIEEAINFMLKLKYVQAI